MGYNILQSGIRHLRMDAKPFFFFFLEEKTSILHQFTELKASGGYFTPG